MRDPSGKTDWAERLAAALGRGWYVSCDPNYRMRWQLVKESRPWRPAAFCRARRRRKLLRSFVSMCSFLPGVAANWDVPERLSRCGSAAELKLVLEAAGA